MLWSGYWGTGTEHSRAVVSQVSSLLSETRLPWYTVDSTRLYLQVYRYLYNLVPHYTHLYHSYTNTISMWIYTVYDTV